MAGGPRETAIPTSVVKLAWPVMVANLLQILTITVDLIFVGSLGEQAPSAVAAVGLGGQFLFLFFGVMIAVSTGTIALVARSMGAKDVAQANIALKQSFALAAVLSVPLTIIGLVLAEPVLVAFGATPEVVALGTSYIRIVSLSVVFQFIGFLGAAALRGSGDTLTPLYIGAGVNLVNGVADYFLIFGSPLTPPLGVAGAAIATSLAFVTGATSYLVLFLRGRRKLRLSLRGSWFRGDTVRRILRIGWPAALEQIMLQVAFLVWVAMVVGFGTDILAAHQIGLRIQAFAFMPGLGFAIAATALVGQNLGARQPDAAERKGWEAAKWSVAVMGTIALAIYFLAPWLAAIFIADPEVIEYTVLFIRIHALSIPAVGIFFAIDGALRGAGDTRYPLAVSLSGMYAVRLPIGYILGFVLGIGIIGVWIPLVIEYWYRAGVISAYYRRGRWKSVRV